MRQRRYKKIAFYDLTFTYNVHWKTNREALLNCTHPLQNIVLPRILHISIQLMIGLLVQKEISEKKIYLGTY